MATAFSRLNSKNSDWY